MVLDPRRYAIAVLLEPDELMMKPDLARIELLGARLHKRFETNLREIGAAAGTGL
jgi:erythromycin esterase-like protein